MKVLITGVAGFMGSRLARWILEHLDGVEVSGVDDLSLGFLENVPPEVEFVEARLGCGETDRLETLFARGVDVVYHMAAHPAEGLSPFIRCRNYRDNLLATAEIVNLCLRHGVGRLVFTSSMAVYGQGRAPFAEGDPVAPIDPYGVAKAASERDIRIAGEQHGLDWTIIRPHNVYGAGQSLWNPYRNVLAIWMARRLQGLPLLVYGDGRQVRAFSFIDDCLEPLSKAATEPQASREIVNLGGTQPVTVREAAELVAGITGGSDIEHREQRHEVRNAWCTWEKSRWLIGYADHTSLGEGIAHMWEWASAAWEEFPGRRRSADVAVEVEYGLYPFWQKRP